MLKKGLAVAVILLFVGTSIIPSVTSKTVEQPSLPISNGNTFYVGGTGEGNYTKIQDAIDDAVDGDTVFVYNGTYYETNIVINKSIDVIGEERDITFIDGSEDVYIIFRLKGGEVTIKNFTLQNGLSGIDIWDGCKNYVISNNIIRNQVSSGISMISWDIGTKIVENNIIYSNGDGGIDVFSSYCTIRNNTLWLNGGQQGYSNICINGNHNIVSGNKINNTIDWRGIEVADCSGNSIVDNYISNCEVGILLTRKSISNSIIGNHLYNNEWGVHIVRGSSYNKIDYNTFIENDVSALFGVFSYFNRWDGNYWDKSRSLPYLIVGRLVLFIPLINIDWHPAQEPYDI